MWLLDLLFGRRRAVAHATALNCEMESIVEARAALMRSLTDQIARTKGVLRGDVPLGPGAGLVYCAEVLLTCARADAGWVHALRRAEFEVGMVAAGGDEEEARGRLNDLVRRNSDVAEKVAQCNKVLGRVQAAQAYAMEAPAAIEQMSAAAVASLILFTPDLAIDIIHEYKDLASASAATQEALRATLQRRQAHMRICQHLPHRRKVSRRVQAKIELAASAETSGAAESLSEAHGVVSMAMSAIHREQLG